VLGVVSESGRPWYTGGSDQVSDSRSLRHGVCPTKDQRTVRGIANFGENRLFLCSAHKLAGRPMQLFKNSLYRIQEKAICVLSNRKIQGDELARFGLGSNSRVRALNARRLLGWKPSGLSLGSGREKSLATQQAPRLTLEMLATSENTQSDHRTSPCDFRSPRSKRVHWALNRPSFEDLPRTSHRI
jgi:hypothetical protein